MQINYRNGQLQIVWSLLDCCLGFDSKFLRYINLISMFLDWLLKSLVKSYMAKILLFAYLLSIQGTAGQTLDFITDP